jgi:XTP/dITP diphosphohydrolase
MRQTKIILATGNKHKIEEVQAILGSTYHVLGLKDLPPCPETIEDQDTFEGNSAKKAREVSAFFKCLVLADDSGLEVDALGGAPGVLSARYCGVHGNDNANIETLLANLQGKAQRSARFVCAATVADNGKVLATFRGTLEGEIIDERRGTHGFGYDPIMFVPQYGKTVAELPSDIKNSMSHRKQAFERMREFLKTYAGESGFRRGDS